MKIIQRTAVWLRRMLLAAAGNVSLFFVSAFIIPHLMCGFPIAEIGKLASMLETYLVFPWGTALCLLTLYRREQAELRRPRADLCIMFVLLLWITVPFIYRFGWTWGNLSAAHGYMIVFFGLYASIVTEDAQRCGKLLDTAAALLAVFSFFFAGALLSAAWGHTIIAYRYGVFPFGVHSNGSLCAGIHYNGTALAAACGAIMCLIGFVRRKNLLAKILHLIPAVMMILVVILTQSRTSRYALIAAFAAVAYGWIASGYWHKRAVVRHAAGILAGIVVAAVGYTGAQAITNAALYRYAVVDAQRQAETANAETANAETAKKEDARVEEQAPVETMVPEPATLEAEDTPAPLMAADEAAAQTQEIKPAKSRGLGDATFTGRTELWESAFKVLSEDPAYLWIGVGHGRGAEAIGKYSVQGVIDAHNAFIQAILDFGVVGLVLLLAILALAVPHAWRLFFARPDHAVPGGRLLCAMIVMGLVSGLMEIEIFHVMRYTNLTFFYVLAMIAVFGRDMVE